MGGGQKVRIGVIGAGTWSQYAHLPAIKAHPEAELHAVCQRTEDKLRATAAKWGIPHAFTDYRKMLDSGTLEGVIVSTPHDFHYEPVKYALENGLHVLVEKPMVIETGQARELVALARAGQPSLMARLLERLGGLLIKIGERLRKRPTPQNTGPLGWAEK